MLRTVLRASSASVSRAAPVPQLMALFTAVLTASRNYLTQAESLLIAPLIPDTSPESSSNLNQTEALK
ncbi:hypothetical protein J6590_007003 [Homalodisca vitripennis]|nr:hypothetical protein J6590_007003 [Homalodisca vitripennis]